MEDRIGIPSPTAIEEVVRSMSELTNNYQIAVGKNGDIDDIHLEIEFNPGHEDKNKEEGFLNKLKDLLWVKLYQN
ncbi:MAG: hypothetical protein KBE27_08065 [Syntrophorhabdaceae bacterium]|nr:hypothetical protein [Syntrophorhabdaceae bacterium]